MRGKSRATCSLPSYATAGKKLPTPSLKFGIFCWAFGVRHAAGVTRFRHAVQNPEREQHPTSEIENASGRGSVECSMLDVHRHVDSPLRASRTRANGNAVCRVASPRHSPKSAPSDDCFPVPSAESASAGRVIGGTVRRVRAVPGFGEMPLSVPLPPHALKPPPSDPARDRIFPARK